MKRTWKIPEISMKTFMCVFSTPHEVYKKVIFLYYIDMIADGVWCCSMVVLTLHVKVKKILHMEHRQKTLLVDLQHIFL
jgi:hypothetical protein